MENWNILWKNNKEKWKLQGQCYLKRREYKTRIFQKYS